MGKTKRGCVDFLDMYIKQNTTIFNLKYLKTLFIGLENINV